MEKRKYQQKAIAGNQGAFSGRKDAGRDSKLTWGRQA